MVERTGAEADIVVRAGADADVVEGGVPCDDVVDLCSVVGCGVMKVWCTMMLWCGAP